MKFEKMIARLEQFGKSLPVLLDGLSDEDAKWKPESGNWSILEIVCHLIDEEKEDFWLRFRMTLEEPGQPWPKWDPEGAAVSREYNQRDLQQMISEFVQIRCESIAWLKGLKDVDFDASYEHPKVGPVPAGLLFASWVAHDQLHLRQIAKRMYEMTIRDAEGYDVEYAGGW